MNRSVLLIAALVIGVVCLLFWLGSRALSSLNERNDAIEKVREGRSTKHVDPASAGGPKTLPRKEAFEWLRLELPAADAEARMGGAVIASCRGNAACFRRRSLRGRAWVHGVCTTSKVTGILEALKSMAEPKDAAAAFRIVVTDGATRIDRRIGEADAAAIFARFEGSGEPWVPAEITVRLEPCAAPSSGEVETWPALPELPPLAELTGEGKTIAGLRANVDQAMKALAKDRPLVMKGDPAAFRLVSFDVALPK